MDQGAVECGPEAGSAGVSLLTGFVGLLRFLGKRTSYLIQHNGRSAEWFAGGRRVRERLSGTSSGMA